MDCPKNRDFWNSDLFSLELTLLHSITNAQSGTIKCHLRHFMVFNSPVEIRQFLDRLARETNLPIDFDEIFNNINGSRTLCHPDRVIDPNLYPPIQEINRQIETWMKNNPERRLVVYLFFSRSMEQRERRVRRVEWMRRHPGQEEIIELDFMAGDPIRLTERQREEALRIFQSLNL